MTFYEVISGRHDLALFPDLSAMLGFVKGFRSPFEGVEKCSKKLIFLFLVFIFHF